MNIKKSNLGKNIYKCMRFLTIVILCIFLLRVTNEKLRIKTVGQSIKDVNAYVPGAVFDTKGKIIARGTEPGKIKYEKGMKAIYDTHLGLNISDSFLDRFTVSRYSYNLYGIDENRLNLKGLFHPNWEHHGGNVKLTLDTNIMKKLSEIETNYNGKGNIAGMIVSNYKTGAIIGVNGDCFNKRYHPGSTMKIVDSILALEVDPSLKKFECVCSPESHDFKINNKNYKIDCYGGTAHGEMNIYSAMAFSCNNYFEKLLLQVDRKELKEKLKDIGMDSTSDFSTLTFNDPTFFGTTPLNSTDETVNVLYSAIGQGNCFTTVFSINCYTNVIANNGMLIEPHIISEKAADCNSNLEKVELMKKNICSKDIANIIKEAMQGVVDYGTASRYLKDYNVIAKTGTAENVKIEKNNKHISYNTSWITLASLNKKRPYSVTVAIDKIPTGADSTDTQKIAQQICKVLGVQ